MVKKENETFYGKNYHTYKVEGRIHSINYTVNFTEFYRVYDLAYIGGNPWYGGRGWLIYDPPMERFKFLEVGKKWNQTITMIFYNGSCITQNTTFIVYYEYIKEENVKTRAGNFKCYVVKEQKEKEPPDCYFLYYFSPSIKNVVMVQHSFYGEIFTMDELIYTTYGKKHHINLYFTFIIVFIIMLITYVFYWSLKNIAILQ